MDRNEIDALITALSTGDKNTALEVRTILFQMNAAMHQPGDIIWINCDAAYITANFDATGLGKNLRSGYAICNGINVDIDLTWRVPVGWGDGTGDVGSMGGSKNAVVVAHNHNTIAKPFPAVLHEISNAFCHEGQTWASAGTADVRDSGIASAGESGVGKNMQPYTILLAIQKL